MTNTMAIMPTLPRKKSDIERDCVIVVDRQDIKQRIVYGIRVRVQENEE